LLDFLISNFRLQISNHNHSDFRPLTYDFRPPTFQSLEITAACFSNDWKLRIIP